jgi:hypothetical protein
MWCWWPAQIPKIGPHHNTYEVAVLLLCERMACARRFMFTAIRYDIYLAYLIRSI